MVEPNTLKESILMIGNPGTGKSTILNAIIGRIVFKAGFKLGAGMTSALQEVIIEDRRYVDTPGLSDMEMLKVAAEEITKALRMGGKFRIFFIVTLEAGRIKPDDLTTMNLVLDAAVEIGNGFSIIVNKVTQKGFAQIQKQGGVAYLKTLFAKGTHMPSNKLFINMKDNDLEDAEDALTSLNEELIKFILQDSHTVEITPEMVQKVKENEFESIKEKLSKEINKLQEDAALANQEMEKFQKEVAVNEKEQKKQHDNEMGILREKCKEAQQTAKDAKEAAQRTEKLLEKAKRVASIARYRTCGFGVANNSTRKLYIGLSMGATHYSEQGVPVGQLFYRWPGAVSYTVYVYDETKKNMYDVYDSMSCCYGGGSGTWLRVDESDGRLKLKVTTPYEAVEDFEFTSYSKSCFYT